MIGKVFVDTTAIVSYFDGSDIRYDEAKDLIARIGEHRIIMVISDYIFDESITTIKSRVGHAIAVRAGEYILQCSAIDVVWLNHEAKLRAWEYFVRHDDKGYSFTDCTSFALMKEMNLKYYLAFDKHFEQAGFRSFSR